MPQAPLDLSHAHNRPPNPPNSGSFSRRVRSRAVANGNSHACQVDDQLINIAALRARALNLYCRGLQRQRAGTAAMAVQLLRSPD